MRAFPSVKLLSCVSLAVLLLQVEAQSQGEVSLTNAPAPWLQQPISMKDCVDIALQNNSTILKGRSDLEAAYGVVVQTRAIAIPKVRSDANYQKTQASGVETFPAVPSNIVSPFPHVRGDQRWDADIRLVQSIYEGGRITSALRTARLTKEQALSQYQAVIADTLLLVRVAYNDVLLDEQQILVQEASVKLLTTELDDQKRRFEAGTVPRFNVLRAEVELANSRPNLIRARNSFRIAKNALVNLLGYNLPKEVWQDIPLHLSDPLEAEPYSVELGVAIGQALRNRPELAVLRKAVSLAKENVLTVEGARKPSVQVFSGYGGRNSMFTDDLTRTVAGWYAGAELTWDIFDGLYTKGKIDEANALQRKAQFDLEENTRRIELEVRTSYSDFTEAADVLESQKKVQEQAEEALRLARVRSEAGTGTQLDVLSAQTALTQARSTQIQALRDYAVARARLERAMGQNILQQH
jgi:outer membrane protein